MRIRRVAVAAFFTVAGALGACDSLPSNPQEPGIVVPLASSGVQQDDALRRDAAAYAARYGVSEGEALDRLRVQHAAGALNAALQANHPETFAGMSIEHQPSFAVVARFTRNGEQVLRGAAVDPSLARVLRAENANVPLRVLQRRLEAAYSRVRGKGVQATGALNVRANRPEIYVPAHSAAAARAAVPADAGAEVVIVDGLPQNEAFLYGGLNINLCTSGFYVKNSAGTRGISTAGHCPNSQSYSGTLTFQSEYDSGAYDVQWHTQTGATYSNIIKEGSSTRAITATKAVGSQVSGEWVCKQGMATGNTCGTLSSTSYCFETTCTWVYVDGGSVNLSEGGDSGGPWYSGNTAYGQHVFGGGNNSGYMPVDYFAGLGLTIQTYAPLSASLSGTQYIARHASVQYTATAGGGVSPFTFEWRQRDGYNWSFGAWSSYWNTGSTNTTYTSVNSCGINQKELQVRITDAVGQVETASYNIFITNPC